MKLKITIGDKYGPAMEITDQKEADRYWKECVEHNLRCQKAEGLKPDRAKAERIEKQNLGYFAGYYTHATRERVERLFRCAHPVFGKATAHKPTPEEAFAAGVTLGNTTSLTGDDHRHDGLAPAGTKPKPSPVEGRAQLEP